MWDILLTGGAELLDDDTAGPTPTDAFITDLTPHSLQYYAMPVASAGIGIVLMMEQYFGKRISCFQAINYNEPATTISEYCWEHGHFARNETSYEMDSSSNLPNIITEKNWLLKTYVYYFIRAFLFILPHLVWHTRFEPLLLAMLKGTEDLIKELQRQWVKYSLLAQHAYRTLQNLEALSSSVALAQADQTQVAPSTSVEPSERRTRFLFNAIMQLTRDVCQITQAQIPQYSVLLGFTLARAAYDLLLLLLFSVADITLLLACQRFRSTDFSCPLLNGEQIRCVVPMLDFQWNGALVSAVCTLFCALLAVGNTVWLLHYLISRKTDGCLLERLPFARDVAYIEWEPNHGERQTYKLLCLYIDQNVSIIHPLNFMRAFVEQLKNDTWAQPAADDEVDERERGSDKDVVNIPMVNRTKVRQRRRRAGDANDEEVWNKLIKN